MKRKIQLISAVPVALGLIFASATPARSATYTATDQAALQSAINQAAAMPGDDTITIENDIMVTSSIAISASSGMITIDGSDHKVSADTTATRGYGIFAITGAATVVLNNMTISDAQGSSSNSGGIYVNNGAANVIVNNCTISNNIGSYGGGMSVYSGIGVLNNCTLSGNSASNGGAIAAATNVTVRNCTLANNSAASSGGGIFLNSGTLNVDSSTISNNTTSGGAGTGGGIYKYTAGASGVVKNSIVANNTAEDMAGNGGVPASYSLIENPGSLSYTGSNNIVGQDPQLGPLQDNGGPTQTMALLDGSPAINAGASDGAPATDQRGVSRPQGAANDIGAFEVAVNVPPAVSNISKTVNEDTELAFAADSFDAGFSDGNGDALQKIKITSLPASGVLQLGGADVAVDAEIARADLDTLTYAPNANFNGTDFFNWNGSDGTTYAAASAKVNITVTAVNDAPSFTPGADVTVDENSGAYSEDWATNISAGPDDENTQALTFHLSNDNNDLFAVQPTISEAGVLSFTPAADGSGSAIVTVSLSDDGGTENGGDDESDEETFTITVTPAPAVVQPDLLIKRDDEADSAYAIDDVYQSTPAGEQIEAQEIANEATNVYQVLVENDGEEARTFVVRARENEFEGYDVAYFVDETDITTQVTGGSGYTTSTLAPGQSIVITIGIGASDPAVGEGKSLLLEVFNDGADTTVRDAVAINVTPSVVNHAPILSSIGDRSVNEGNTLSLTVAATDGDGDTLEYSAGGLPAGASFNATTRTFSWTPAEAQGPGSYQVTFTASDGELSDSETVTITVREVNAAPVLELGGNRTLTGGVPFSFGITAYDSDLPKQGFGVYPVNPPSWIGITGGPTIYGTPPVSSSPYTQKLTIAAGDSWNARTEKSITLTINPPRVVWMVESSWSGSEGTLTYRLKNNTGAAITGVWVGGQLRVPVKSITKSIGTTSWATQGNGYYGLYWDGFNLAAGAEATMVVKVPRPSPGLPVANTLYCAYGPGSQPTLTTPDVRAK